MSQAGLFDRPASKARFEATAVWLRFMQVWAVIALAFARVTVPLIIARVLNNRDRCHYLLGHAIAQAAEQLGPVFVKLAQMISYRADVLPIRFLAPLARLQENAIPMLPGEARRTLELAFGSRWQDIFIRFDDAAIASGSIATVHLAQLENGDLVALKIVRPSASNAIRRDIACLRWAVDRIARRRFAVGFPIREMFESIAGMIAVQCDMVEEARNLDAFSRILSSVRDVKVPAVRTDLGSVREVLVMDYIDCTTTISDPSLSDVAFRAAILQVLRQLYRMIFTEGIVHCDLHPGNVHLRKDGTVYLFDAGLVSSLSIEERECFRDFFVAIATGDTAAATSAVIRSALSVPADLDRRRLEGNVRDLIKRNTGLRAGEFLVAGFVHQVLALQRTHRIYGSPGFVAAIWALAMFEGLVRHRFPDLDFQGEAKTYVISAMLRKVRRSTG